ncbi:hypothetical protein OHA70_08980 [Kribbella sp. NBC_00382]
MPTTLAVEELAASDSRPVVPPPPTHPTPPEPFDQYLRWLWR